MHAFPDFLKLFAVWLGIIAVIFIGVLIGALLIELGLSRDDGHVSFAAGGLLAACALDVWLMVRWPWLIAAWFGLFVLIVTGYRWYGRTFARRSAVKRFIIRLYYA